MKNHYSTLSPGNTRYSKFLLSWARLLFLSLLLAGSDLFAAASGYSVYYVPGDELTMNRIFDDISAGDVANNDMHVVVGVTSWAGNTVLCYDHWEDGYDYDPQNPASTCDEQVTLSAAGAAHTFESSNVSLPRPAVDTGNQCVAGSPGANERNCDYDGADRIFSTGGNITVNRASWVESVGVFQSVAWEVYPLTPQLTSYVLPFGEDLAGTMPDFNRVYATVQAFEDGTVLRVDFDADGTADTLYDRDGTTPLGTQITLSRGETFLIDRTSRGNQPTLDTGARIEANNPVQVQYVIGDQDSTYEIRGLSAFPRGFWSNRYYAPVTSASNADTDIFLFNPHPTTMTVKWDTRAGTGTFTIPSGQTVSFRQRTGSYVPVDSAVYLEGSDVFWGVSTVDTGSSASDWAYSLVPAELLTSENYLAWAPGAQPPSIGEADDSGIYISPAQDAIRVFVDFDADGNADQTYDLGRLETQYVFDASDGDMSNARIWATGPYAAAYGQNPAFAPPGLPAIDVGYTMLPSLEADTVLDVEKTADPVVVPTAIGSTSVYTLTITSKNYSVDQITANDALPPGWAYVAGSTTITRADLTTLSGAAADPGGSGWTAAQLGDLGANQTIVIQFSAATTQAFSVGDVTENQITASGTRTVGGMVQTFTTTDFVFNTFGELQVAKASSGIDPLSPGDQFTYTVTVSNPAASAATYSNVAVYDPMPAGVSYVSGSSQVSIDKPVVQVTEYYVGPGDFGGTVLDLTLNHDLSSDYFVMVRGSAGDGTSGGDRGPNSNYVSLTADPFGTGDLGNSSGSNVIRLTRNDGSDDWIGVVTVVEAMGDTAGSGFRLLDVQRVTHGGGSTSGTDTSAASWNLSRVMLMGGYKGAGCDSTDGNRGQNVACHARIWPTGTNTINWTRGGSVQPGTLAAATSTVMVVEWGNDWTVQSVRVSGSNGDDGVDATGEYNTAAISAVARNNTWVWGTGHTDYDGLGEAGEGAVVTLGDGVNQNAVESSVAVGLEYANLGLDYQVYALTHNSLAVDYRFKSDGDTTSLTVDVPVDSAGSNRMAVSYNGQNGRGTAYPRPIFSARYLNDATVRLERRRTGQPFPAWVQGIDFSAFPTVPVTAAAGSPPNFVTPADGYSVAPGETLTLTFDVLVDNPLATGITSITNLASVTTDQTPVPVTDTVTNIVNNPSAQTGTIGDRIWLDANADGVLNVGESGLGNVTLTLRDQFGTPVATTVSDSNGFYTFTGVQAGTGYYVEATSGVPSGLVQSAPSGHSDNRTDSFDLAPGQDYTSADLGYTSAPLAASLGDRVWSDADGDGIQDAGEPGLSGVTVSLYADGGDGIFNPGEAGSDDTLVTTTVSAADGSYLFTGVTATGTEDYWVAATPPAGYTGTTFGAFYYADVNGGDTLLNADFGFQGTTTPTYGIADRIWFDADSSGGVNGGEGGLAGVSVDLLDASLNVIATVTTDANGYFSFSGVPNGNYTVKVTDTAGVLNDYYGTTTAATSGQYGITNLSADLDNTGSPSFGYNLTRSIGDTVFNDLDGDGLQGPGEPGISGVTVELLDGSCTSGVDCPTVVTDASGSYLFSGLSDGSYSVSVDGTQPALSGYNLTTNDDGVPGSPYIRNVTLTGGVSQLGIDFGFQAATPTSVSGTVWDDKDESGDISASDGRIQDVSVDLIRNGVVVATATTDVDGVYAFSGLVPGTYTVRVTDTGGVLNGYNTTYEVTEGVNNPPYNGEETVTTTAGDVANINFGYYYPKPTLVSVVGFGAYAADSGAVYVTWETASETGTAGFRVERFDAASGEYVPVNQEPLPSLGVTGKPGGGDYSLRDDGAAAGGTYLYRLIEEEVWGSQRIYGPYKVTVGIQETPTAQDMSSGKFSMRARSVTPPPETGHTAEKQLLDATRQYDGDSLQVGFPARKDGLVFVNLVDLQQMTGLSLDQLFSSGSVRLSNKGQTVAWWPVANGGGYYAYVQHIDSLFTLDNVYQLQDGAGVMMALQSVPPLSASVVTGFTHTEHIEKDLFAATAITQNPDSDYWYWDFLMAGNGSYERKSFDVDLPDVRAGRRIKLLLKGFNTKIHTLEIRVNGQPVGSDTWFGISEHQVDLQLPSAILVEGVNTVELYATGVSGQGFYLDSIEVVYERTLQAHDGRLAFGADADQTLLVSGFGSDVLNLVDVTDPLQPVWLSDFEVSGVPGAYNLSFQARGGHAYTVAEAAAVPAAAFRLEEISAWNFTSLDYLLISPWSMREEAHQLAAYRDRTGLKAAVVYLKDIYRVYGHGIESPEAIRAFLQDAKSKWQVRYVTLAGSASYDYRNLLGYDDSVIPTLMAATPYGLVSCDTCLADFDADGLAELVVGRIPAANGAALEQYLGKLADYEARAPVDITMMLADDKDVAAGDFPADSDTLAQAVSAAVSVQKVYLDNYATFAEAKTDFLTKFNAGVDWLNYVGHGADDRLAEEGILTTADVAGLTNEQSAVVTALTCGANRFEVPGSTALGEELVLVSHGAVASWAPSGLSLNTPAVALGNTLFGAVYQSGEHMLGEAVDIAMYNTGNVPGYMRHIYALLGDSAVHLFGSATVESQTNLSDLAGGSSGGVCSLNADTVWTAASGPYVMDCDLVVEAGVILRVDAGVTIKSDKGRKITARGSVQIMGEGASPVRILPRIPGGNAPVIDFVQEGAGSIAINGLSISR